MNENFKDYFYFSKGEKNGIIILLTILILLIIFPYFYDYFSKPDKNDYNKFQDEIQLFSKSIEETEEPEFKNKLDQYIIERYDSINLFFFDPNKTSKTSYSKLGFTDKQIKTIFNYLDKGGKFYVKDDFRKIYGIRQQQFQILKPYILLPDNEKVISTDNVKNEINRQTEQKNEKIFVFDPNTASNEDFTRLGLSEYQITTIRNFQKKAGKFKTKEDFKKIYVISEDKYLQLEPYIYIEKELEKVPETIIVELNTAGIEELIKLKGIKNFSAEAIIKYRQKLGGYTNPEQLLEIKVINQEMFNYFKNNIRTDKSKLRTISLNFAEIDELVAHPYLDYNQAREIINFRSKNGPFVDKKQLIQNKILLDLSYKKIEPYLTLN